MNTYEDDPFAVFGEDSDTDNDDKTNATPTTAVGSIVSEKLPKIPKLDPSILEVATRTRCFIANDIANGIKQNDTTKATSTDKNTNMNNGMSKFPWPHRLPIYLSPNVRYDESLSKYGGHRGLVSNTLLSPGTLILIETPSVTFPTKFYHSDSTTTTTSSDPNERLIHILYYDILGINRSNKNQQQQQHQQERREAIQQVLFDLEYFHPTKQLVDKCVQQLQQQQTGDRPDPNVSKDVKDQVYDMIHDLHAQYSHHNENKDTSSNSTKFQEILTILCHGEYRNSDNTVITEYDLYRILLALRYNALQSGIYYYSAMLNHSDHPNCVKFLPTTKTTTLTTQQGLPSTDKPMIQYSEIRTTRTVQTDEPLTISYIPQILSYSSRRHYLWQQHRFDIGISNDDRCNNNDDRMEMIHSTTPPMLENIHEYNTTVTYRIESAVTELEDMYRDIQAILQQQQQHHYSNPTTVDQLDTIRQIRELEQAALELCNSSELELLQNSYHILLIPCRRLHVDICDCIQRYDTTLSVADRMKLISRCIVSSYHLRIVQTTLYGSDHYDIARTNLDIVHGIEELLSHSTKHLFAIKLHEMNRNFIPSNITSWTTLVYNIRKDFERIKALYPENVNEYINDLLSEDTTNVKE